MKNIYSAREIAAILEATIGDLHKISELPEPARNAAMARRADFVCDVGAAVAEEVLRQRADSGAKVVVFAGDTINGAYALETARALHGRGCFAEVYLINLGGNLLGADAIAARERFLNDAGEAFLFETVDFNLLMPTMDPSMIVVDGLFGREHAAALKGGYQVMARQINEQGGHIISIDIPSGMANELSVGMVNRNIIHADTTLTLVGPTLSFYMPENAELIGKWKTLPAPVDREAVRACRCASRLTDAWGIRGILPAREATATKADLGTVLIFAGSYGMVGAAVMCTRAALRSGAGKVVCHGPRCAFYIMQTAVPPAMFETDNSDREIRRFESNVNFDAIAVGPGIGHAEDTVDGLEVFLKAMNAAKRPVVLDADALNCIALRPSLLDHIPARSVITPHAGEFDRLFGPQPSSSARLLKACEMARKYRIVILLKSHFAQTVWPDGAIIVNNSGTDALATAGSGDVLTGLLAGLMAQGMIPELAAVAAAYVHGVAGELAAAENGRRGVTADDIALEIGNALEAVLDAVPAKAKKSPNK